MRLQECAVVLDGAERGRPPREAVERPRPPGRADAGPEIGVAEGAAEYYLDTIKTVFQEFKLVNGTWDVRGINGQLEKVRPEDITTTAHFTVEGELDDISGSGQTEAAHGLCYNIPKALQKHLEVKGAGHYGIFAGRRWRDVVYPAVKAFILEHNKAAAHETHAPVAIEKIATPQPVRAAISPEKPKKIADAVKPRSAAIATPKLKTRADTRTRTSLRDAGKTAANTASRPVAKAARPAGPRKK